MSENDKDQRPSEEPEDRQGPESPEDQGAAEAADAGADQTSSSESESTGRDASAGDAEGGEPESGEVKSGDAWAQVTDSVRDAVSTATQEFQTAFDQIVSTARQRRPGSSSTDEVEDDQQARRDEEQARRDEEGARREEEEELREEERAFREELRADERALREEERAVREEERAAREEGRAGSLGYTDSRDVLDAVAAGAISPEEAAVILDRLAGGGEAAIPEADEPKAVTRLRIRAIGRRVRLIGEPFVRTVAIDGPHVVRQDGDTLVVTSEGEFGASLDGFTLTPPRSLRDVQQKFFDLGRELAIRVNPELLVDAEVTAGSINAERLPRLEQVRATAASVRVRDVEGPLDLLVQAGSAQVEGRIVSGRSRLRTESGSLQLRLLKGSNVRIRPDAQLGRVIWDPARGEADEHVIGSGAARLDLEVVMGQATVKEAP